MTDRPRDTEMTALLAAILAAQWFSSTADNFLAACGNAVFLAMAVCGAALALIAFLLEKFAPERGLLEICTARRGFAAFPIICALLFTLLGATALRDTLTLLGGFLLPQSPRWFLLLLLLPPLILAGYTGAAPVARAVRLTAPVLVALYALVLVLSLWRQANVYNLFPLLGGGLPKLAQTALSGLSVAAWLPILLIDRPKKGVRRSGARACLYATALCVAGYLAYALLFPSGAEADAAFPLHRMSTAGGFSVAFQRTRALFVFVWLPVQMAAVSAALCYASRSLHAAFHAGRGRALLLVPLALILLLGYAPADRSPAWLAMILQTNTQALLLIPLLIPLIAGKIAERKRGKEARHA